MNKIMVKKFLFIFAVLSIPILSFSSQGYLYKCNASDNCQLMKDFDQSIGPIKIVNSKIYYGLYSNNHWTISSSLLGDLSQSKLEGQISDGWINLSTLTALKDDNLYLARTGGISCGVYLLHNKVFKKISEICPVSSLTIVDKGSLVATVGANYEIYDGNNFQTVAVSPSYGTIEGVLSYGGNDFIMSVWLNRGGVNILHCSVLNKKFSCSNIISTGTKGAMNLTEIKDKIYFSELKSPYLYYLYLGSNEISKIEFKNQYVESVSKDDNGNVWVSSVPKY